MTDSRNTSTAVLPEQFGKYSLLGHLATGGMAEVWLARHVGMQGFEKIVVIKRARPELSDRETTRLFLDEARLVATLQHPNIAQVYEIGSVSGSYFFVMEYVDGADLRRLIEASLAKRQRIPLADAIYIMTHVCTALHYAHQKHDPDGRALQIIHRDVSPSNVLLSHDGGVKVCDFGVAKAHSRNTESTQPGVLKGKFSYMSPEQAQGKPLDRRSDVFSIGILLYELTTLTKLFRGAGDYALLQQVVEAQIAPPSLRIPEYPPELERIVMKALAKDPALRYQTAQAMQLDLEEFAREHKLAMSSVRIAKLMGSLFEKRSDALLRTARGSAAPMQDIRAIAGDDPTFLADGSGPSAPSSADSAAPSPAADTGSHAFATRRTNASATPLPVPSHRSSSLWLIGAVLAGMVAIAITIADRMIAGAEDRAAASALTSDAERISALFDAAARSAHMRADGIATTPMLRAAIETDAATLKDLTSTEMVLAPEKGEVLEIFQLRGEVVSPLLRMPRTAGALPPLRGRGTQISSDGQAVTLIVSAPISGYHTAVAGGIALATPVDLTSIRRSLDEHTLRASLTGLGTELALAGPRDAPRAGAAELPVPSSAQWGIRGATLIATSRPAAGLSWAASGRAASGALGALLLFAFVVSLARRPRLEVA
ncbi:MAG TPA: serine/threonine-protein kinase [Kofleriaceae bacterium]|nr:serine/threonine-protein kinase [Kofleriaceae bacterium]